MFREMRRSERKINNSDAIEILEKCEYGVLSTVNENGYAYGVPLSYAYKDGSIYFHCALEGHKLDNIKNNNRVSFCVVGNTGIIPEKFTTRYESVIVFGSASEVFGEEKSEALLAIIEKYSKEYIAEGKKYIKNADSETKIIKISIEHMTGKAHK